MDKNLPEDALALAEKGVATTPGDARVWLARAIAMPLDVKAARPDLERALALDPDSGTARFVAMQVDSFDQKLDAALADGGGARSSSTRRTAVRGTTVPARNELLDYDGAIAGRDARRSELGPPHAEELLGPRPRLDREGRPGAGGYAASRPGRRARSQRTRSRSTTAAAPAEGRATSGERTPRLRGGSPRPSPRPDSRGEVAPGNLATRTGRIREARPRSPGDPLRAR